MFIRNAFSTRKASRAEMVFYLAALETEALQNGDIAKQNFGQAQRNEKRNAICQAKRFRDDKSPLDTRIHAAIAT